MNRLAKFSDVEYPWWCWLLAAMYASGLGELWLIKVALFLALMLIPLVAMLEALEIITPLFRLV